MHKVIASFRVALGTLRTHPLIFGTIIILTSITVLFSAGLLWPTNVNETPSVAAVNTLISQSSSPESSLTPVGTDTTWVGNIQDNIRQEEYHITWQEETTLPNEQGAYQAPNREHNFRTYFVPDGIYLQPRTEITEQWLWGLKLTGFGYADNMQPVSSPELMPDKSHIAYQRDSITEWYSNREEGLEQGFTLNHPPAAKEDQAGKPDSHLIIELAVVGTLLPEVAADGAAIDFNTSNGTRVLHYSKLVVFDAEGQSLPAHMQVSGCTEPAPNNTCQLQLVINDNNAIYPIVIDPIASDPDWSESGGQTGAEFGYDVAGGGDVNGDGYADAIVSAPYYDNGEADEGRIFIYHGSATGLSLTANQIIESNQAGAHFGLTVASASDVNDDGYDDIIVGAPDYDGGQTDEGAAFIYYGSANGVAQTADWTEEGNQSGAHFGYDVGNAGDVDNNGYDDIIIGAPDYDNDQNNEGRVFVYTNNSTGLTNTPWTAESDKANSDYGYAVSTAGDVNGDGYDDIIVGAPLYREVTNREGRVYVYYGSSSGLNNTPWLMLGSQTLGQLGTAVGTAGDVNGDGYDDIVIGSHLYDDTDTDEGQAVLYYGSSSGFASGASPDWIATGPHNKSHFGYAVDTGDVNNDGYDDLIVGVLRYDNGSIREGGIFVYYGQSGGLPATASWIADEDSPDAELGHAVAAVGDVNGDGYDDIIAGAHDNNDEGAAFSYYGSADGLSTFADWTSEGDQGGAWFGDVVSTAGDVNGDGYDDIIIGAPRYDNGQANEGRVFVYHGSHAGVNQTADWTAEGDQANAFFGQAVAAANDIDGDGYDDIIVGAPRYDNGQTNEGCIHVYYGSAAGLDATTLWTAESDQADASLGHAVGGAGDINNDGYADIIAGMPYYDGGYSNEGQVVVYYGAASRLISGQAADWTAKGGKGGARLGTSVDTAGDVNGDGYDDVIMAALRYGHGNGYHGRVVVYHGSSSGLGTASQPDWVAMNDAPSQVFGTVVGDAGDVNGDGYGDVLIGDDQYDNDETDEGRVLVYHGSVNGLSNYLQPDWTADECNQGQCEFGDAADAAGDFNGDGYDDLIVGAPGYTDGENQEGAAYIYHGSATGLSSTSDWLVESDKASAIFGAAVSTAGNVNGDGYDDVIIGSPRYEHGNANEGIGALFYGPGDSGNWAVADFSAVPISGTVPLTVTFTNLSQNGINYFWQFGDGVTSTLTSPIHTYTQTGIYTVTLTAYGSEGLPNVLALTNYITVSETVAPMPLAFTHGWTAEGNLVNANLGYSASTAGDVNGDGYDDVIIGTRSYDGTYIGGGQVRLYQGSAIGLSRLPAWIVEGDQTGAELGFSVSTIGDINNDGYADVIVGARSYDEAGFTNNGKVYVYYGSASGLNATADWTAIGDASGDLFGHAVALAGDVNGDGFNDILVGARGYSNGEAEEGRVYLFYGSQNGIENTPAWTAESNDAGAWFGYAVASVGDVNSDGYADIIASAPFAGDDTIDGGKAYVYHGSAAGPSLTPSWEIASTQDGAQMGVGTGVAGVGDVNNDGYDDVLVGAPREDNPEVDEGVVYLYYGSNAGLSATPATLFESNREDANMGWSVAGLGYLNDDPYADFIIGADEYGVASPTSNEGRVYLHYGAAPIPSSVPDWIETGTQVNDRLGHYVGAAGDVDGNGYTDLLITQPRYNGSMIDEGRISIYYTSEITPFMPVANFTANPTSGDAPLDVVFTNLSEYAVDFQWDFGDGITSTAINPSHTYTQTGAFTVSLATANPYGSDVLTQTHVITVANITPVTADFIAAPVSGAAPLTVTFTSTVTGALTYDWHFGDGGTAAEAHPVHIYDSSGRYTVTLTVSGPGGTAIEAKSSYIQVDRSWQQLNITSAPSAGGEYGMTYDSGRDVVVLYGGNATGWPYENSTWEFDGSDWSEVVTSQQPNAVYGMNLVYDSGHSAVTLFGGSDSSDAALAETWVYTDSNWLQLTPAVSPPARSGHQMVYDPTHGDIYLFGGNDGATYFNDLWLFDGTTWSQVTVSGQSPSARTLHALAYDTTTNRLLLFGGRVATGESLADLWTFNTNNNTWTEISANGPAARYTHSMVYDPAYNTQIMVGGVSDAGDIVFNDTWQFQSGSWTEGETIPLPAGIFHHVLIYRDDDQSLLLVTGGGTWEYK